MDKAHALDMLNIIGQNWDRKQDANYRAQWIVLGRQAFDVLQADHDSRLPENPQTKADKARKAYAALDFFNDSPRNSADSKNYNDAQKHLDNLYAVVKEYDGKADSHFYKPKPTRYVMKIRFRTIPQMGDGTVTQQAFFNELAERHNVTVDVTGTNDAEVYYFDRKNADALMDELHKTNAGPYINCDD